MHWQFNLPVMERYQQSMERGHYATCHHYSPGKFSLEFYYFNLLLWENLSILLLRLSHIKAIQKSKWQRTIPQLQVTQAEVYQINAFYWLRWRWPYSCQQINPQSSSLVSIFTGENKYYKHETEMKRHNSTSL